MKKPGLYMLVGCGALVLLGICPPLSLPAAIMLTIFAYYL